jgi:excisionase family DNA binding protein
MYLTIKETAEYLSMPESKIEELIKQKKIRAIHDGEGWVINKEQFNTHLKQKIQTPHRRNPKRTHPRRPRHQRRGLN